MTHELYGESDNWEVESDGQDVRGWDVVDEQGQKIATVSDMYVDTETETIDRLVLDNGSELEVSSVLVEDGTIRLGGTSGAGMDSSYEGGTGTSGDYATGQRTGSAGSYGTGGASGTYAGGETGTETYRAGDMSGSDTMTSDISGGGSQSGTGEMAGGGMTGTTGTTGYESSQGGGSMGGNTMSGGSSTSGDSTMSGGSDAAMGGSSVGGNDAWRIRRQQQAQSGTDTSDMQAEKNYVEEPRSTDV
jgi:sporulation protein YlmC with PRC-barrel domain